MTYLSIELRHNTFGSWEQTPKYLFNLHSCFRVRKIFVLGSAELSLEESHGFEKDLKSCKRNIRDGSHSRSVLTQRDAYDPLNAAGFELAAFEKLSGCAIHPQYSCEKVVMVRSSFKRFLPLFFGSCIASDPAFAQLSRSSLEAAFILQFTKYVEMSEAGVRVGTIKIAVLGDSGLLESLGNALRQKPESSSIDLLREDDLSKANFIVIGAIDGGMQSKLNMIVSSCRCVTVGLTSYPGETMIRLYQHNETLRFEIDKRIADKKGIYISSKLLRLATKVKE
jgi:hypothetical protein